VENNVVDKDGLPCCCIDYVTVQQRVSNECKASLAVLLSDDSQELIFPPELQVWYNISSAISLNVFSVPVIAVSPESLRSQITCMLSVVS